MTQPGHVDLSAASEVRSLLRRHGVRPDRALGQNFLVDRRALARIVDAAGIEPGDTVLEVGAGLGVLTRALAERATRVHAVELDARLLPVLAETLADAPHVTLHQEDAVRFDHGRLPPGSLLVANLPYGIATAVIATALEARRYRRLVVLVQREVAERICARPGEPGYGAFSLVCRHASQPRVVRHVAPGAFLPPPKVTSSVVRMEVDPEAAPDPELFGLIRDAFRHRRKTLVKNLRMAGVTPARAERAVRETGLDGRVRAEALDLEAFRALREALARDPDAPPPG